ncbi:precorrin-3B synthase [Tepidiforma sp.]|uniref:precorrin-3B synthase n=1 Tax=Tepidiforma sp. TaxID=2682230 RepID=UPI002ADE2A88|nr:precorrin-3B synthase [Tepidiforma sp.]
MNKIEAIKQEKDGLDSWEDLVEFARRGVPPQELDEAHLQRFKWYGVFHRPQKPGTFMMRLRITGGRLTSSQARVIAGIAREHGGGTADITTRQNLQLRDLLLPDIPGIIERLSEAGITTRQTGMDNVRNFIGCPLAGIDGMELFDSTPLVNALAEAHLAAGRQFSNLPRKFNVAIAGCRDDCGDAQSQDLGFVPATRERDGRRVAGFNVLVGGALGGTSPRLATPLDVFVTPEEVVPFFLALLRVYRDNGPRDVRTKARLKWLIAEWGEERLRDEVEREFGRPLQRAGIDERLRVAGDHLGIHPQRQVGKNYIGLHVPVGRITANELEGVADLADSYGQGQLRLTVDQNIVIPHIPDAALSNLLAEPILERLKPNPSHIWRHLVACTGNDYCHFSLIDTKRHAYQLASELERRGVQVPRGTRIHVSGCIHACGKHHIADIGLQGTNIRLGSRVEEAADVYVGGRLGDEPRLASKILENVHWEDLPVLVEALVRQRFAQTVPLSLIHLETKTASEDETMEEVSA